MCRRWWERRGRVRVGCRLHAVGIDGGSTEIKVKVLELRVCGHSSVAKPTCSANWIVSAIFQHRCFAGFALKNSPRLNLKCRIADVE